MKKTTDKYLKIIIGVLFIILISVLSFLIGTYTYSNDYSILMVIIFPFWLVILPLLYWCYKKFTKKIFLVLIIISLLYIICSISKGILYERHIQKLEVGLTMEQVENLYGTGTSGIGFGSYGLGSADCTKCNGVSYQFSYRLKSNFWYSHLEDSYHVCYIEDKVCDFDRIGL